MAIPRDFVQEERIKETISKNNFLQILEAVNSTYYSFNNKQIEYLLLAFAFGGIASAVFLEFTKRIESICFIFLVIFSCVMVILAVIYSIFRLKLADVKNKLQSDLVKELAKGQTGPLNPNNEIN